MPGALGRPTAPAPAPPGGRAGTRGGTPVDVTFTCNPTGHVQLEDRTVVELAGEVTRKGIVGTFGCPVDRAEAEFPPRR